ncbi:putative histidine kinase sensor domain protein [Pseudodesulfovibrio profundus]|uniref:Putative histidine kinase sensor domain protein n=1 Tax=Pseudodesulfovibrio profundus TaxID=57320 RepID=A0A2C8FBV9_9BACT|nr:PocR ligand-binding domain-containing protein [Pseudodesulfovibrio profundus]MBC15848.1 transcriptional regulator [Desulfovibrio sp.]SOB59542.1 putative histidine kinase sensor domain protein [Pseudodesulfovibrio profundus]|tara:strand:+ start:346 stop:831 length:486 start_codon:yes stop_codon:yes gene_type:complete
MELTDLMPVEDWVALQYELHDRFGLNADVVNSKGQRLAGNTWGNELCHKLRADSKGYGAICATAGMMFTQMVQEGQPFVEECDAGMTRISVPIVVDGEHLGALGGCGVVAEDGEVDGFTIGMMSNLSEDDISQTIETVSTVSYENIQEIQDYIESRLASLS